MQNLIKTCILIIVLFDLTACGSSKTFKSTVSMQDSVAIENTKKPEDYLGYSVTHIDNCGKGIIVPLKTFSLFGDYDQGLQKLNLSNFNFSGWNHVTNGSDTEWKNLKLTSNNYNFNNDPKENSSCNNVHTLDIVLLKKIVDWNHQHSNGFECNILAHGLKFGDIENLVFDLKINSAKTSIPSVERIKIKYANYVNEETVDALEDGKVNIGITLGDNTNLNGAVIFQLDQVTLSDQWVRVTIPISKLSYYQEIDYKRTPKTFTDLSNVVINRMLIVGETKSGSVLRGNIATWNADIPETFKEMDVSFKKIELQLK